MSDKCHLHEVVVRGCKSCSSELRYLKKSLSTTTRASEEEITLIYVSPFLTLAIAMASNYRIYQSRNWSNRIPGSSRWNQTNTKENRDLPSSFSYQGTPQYSFCQLFLFLIKPIWKFFSNGNQPSNHAIVRSFCSKMCFCGRFRWYSPSTTST